MRLPVLFSSFASPATPPSLEGKYSNDQNPRFESSKDEIHFGRRSNAVKQQLKALKTVTEKLETAGERQKAAEKLSDQAQQELLFRETRQRGGVIKAKWDPTVNEKKTDDEIRKLLGDIETVATRYKARIERYKKRLKTSSYKLAHRIHSLEKREEALRKSGKPEQIEDLQNKRLRVQTQLHAHLAVRSIIKTGDLTHKRRQALGSQITLGASPYIRLKDASFIGEHAISEAIRRNNIADLKTVIEATGRPKNSAVVNSNKEKFFRTGLNYAIAFNKPKSIQALLKAPEFESVQVPEFTKLNFLCSTVRSEQPNAFATLISDSRFKLENSAYQTSLLGQISNQGRPEHLRVYVKSPSFTFSKDDLKFEKGMTKDPETQKVYGEILDKMQRSEQD